jgi:hypothetical protein
MSATDGDGWADLFRHDGLVVRRDGDSYVIVPPGGAMPVRLCPCCDKPFATLNAAMRTAQALYPLQTDRDDPTTRPPL